MGRGSATGPEKRKQDNEYIEYEVRHRIRLPNLQDVHAVRHHRHEIGEYNLKPPFSHEHDRKSKPDRSQGNEGDNGQEEEVTSIAQVLVHNEDAAIEEEDAELH